MKAYLKIIVAMLLWGTLSLVVLPVQLPSALIVMYRIVLGFVFLGAVFLLSRKKTDKEALKKNLVRLLLSGACMGANWAFLFESFRFVDVSVATLAYYCAPVVVIFVSAFLFRETITWKKALCMAASIVGILLVSGTAQMGGTDPMRGLLFGLLSALFYASVTLFNKTVKGLGGLESTLVQLIGAGIVMLPYNLLTQPMPWRIPMGKELICLLILGFIHTGVALYLYFSAIPELPAQSTALCSYIDPASALFFAAIFLGDKLTFSQIIGAVLVIGGAAAGSLLNTKKKENT